MSGKGQDDDPALLFAAPVLCVADMAGAIACFTERLGFRVHGKAGDPTAWASLQRDRVEIMLVAGGQPAPAAEWAAYLYVRDADALHAELRERGADIVGPPRDMPYHIREFEVRLPDGRRLAFGADLGQGDSRE